MESNIRFENLENTITLIQHEHPLHLVDLQPCYPDYVEFSDDEEEDKVIKWDFNSPCNECGKDINVYHRYYYKCTDSCDYALHKECAKARPTTLILKSHSLTHKLNLIQRRADNRFCYACGKNIQDELYYDCTVCPYTRDGNIHVKCAMIGRENHTIYHPSHTHSLVIVVPQPISCKCDACGKEHRGIFYHCITCFDYTIHTDCAFLPRKLQIQHTHPLTISYTSQYRDPNPRRTSFTCRICRVPFHLDCLWSYKCESCRYFAHLDCATSGYESFQSTNLGKTIKNFKDADHPNLVNLPFPDQTYSILQHWFSKESGSTTFETTERNLNHINHEHVLSLVGTQSKDSKGATSSILISLVSCHDPMKSIELLCNGCVRPIMDVPFYKCSSEDQCCDFVLHEWCTRLPAELPNYPGHPQHSLVFLSKVPGELLGIFSCKNCRFYCNGFAYGCTECEYYIDVNCGFIPEEITHEAHPNHILSLRDQGILRNPCLADGSHVGSTYSFSCESCDIFNHSDCAILAWCYKSQVG